MAVTPEGDIPDGRAALARGAWSEARAAFEGAALRDHDPEAYEGLGVACRYLLDADGAFAAHEEGFRRAQAAGEPDLAARLAVQLCYDAYAFRGPAEAAGWAERAGMLVEGRPPSIATGFAPFVRAYLALLARHDPHDAVEGAAAARVIARGIGAVDLEMLATALEGLALVAAGEIAPGMAKLDAAAASAVGGEMTDADSIETVCCFVIDACKRVRDLERANEWCLRVREIATRFGDRQMFSVCRVHYGDVLMWSGDLASAEREFAAAADELARIRPGREADALVRLAEVRRRRGQGSDAVTLLSRSEGHRYHPLFSGHVALDRGDAAAALDEAERFLRRIGPADRFERVAGLELAVLAALAAGDASRAQAAADEIGRIAAEAGSGALSATHLLARGRLARAAGDAAAARALAEDAADGFATAGARWDEAVALGELAGLLVAAGDDGTARRVAARRAAALAAAGAPDAPAPAGGLSPREAEVLRLLAQGLSNADIAHRLVLSVRTVERHVANVYAKIGASGRTARAVATAWAHANGVT